MKYNAYNRQKYFAQIKENKKTYFKKWAYSHVHPYDSSALLNRTLNIQKEAHIATVHQEKQYIQNIVII